MDANEMGVKKVWEATAVHAVILSEVREKSPSHWPLTGQTLGGLYPERFQTALPV